jgi:hypothetical protein
MTFVRELEAAQDESISSVEERVDEEVKLLRGVPVAARSVDLLPGARHLAATAWANHNHVGFKWFCVFYRTLEVVSAAFVQALCYWVLHPLIAIPLMLATFQFPALLRSYLVPGLNCWASILHPVLTIFPAKMSLFGLQKDPRTTALWYPYAAARTIVLTSVLALMLKFLFLDHVESMDLKSQPQTMDQIEDSIPWFMHGVIYDAMRRGKIFSDLKSRVNGWAHCLEAYEICSGKAAEDPDVPFDLTCLEAMHRKYPHCAQMCMTNGTFNPSCPEFKAPPMPDILAQLVNKETLTFVAFFFCGTYFFVVMSMFLLARLPVMRGAYNVEAVEQVERLSKAIIYFVKSGLLDKCTYDNTINIHIDMANDSVKCYKKRVTSFLVGLCSIVRCVRKPSEDEIEENVFEGDLVAWHPEKAPERQWELLDCEFEDDPDNDINTYTIENIRYSTGNPFLQLIFWILDFISDFMLLQVLLLPAGYCRYGVEEEEDACGEDLYTDMGALALGTSLAISLGLQLYRSSCGVMSLSCGEAFESHNHGILTRRFLMQMRPEKSVESYPSLFVNMSLIPVTCCSGSGSMYSRIVSLGSMMMSVMSIAFYAYTEFDLGGAGHAREPQPKTDPWDIEHEEALNKTSHHPDDDEDAPTTFRSSAASTRFDEDDEDTYSHLNYDKYGRS